MKRATVAAIALFATVSAAGAQTVDLGALIPSGGASAKRASFKWSRS